MSRRTTSSGQSVSLFPFLAVLVCVMGSLIFLLLATTRRLRDIAIAEAAAKSAAANAVSDSTPPEDADETTIESPRAFLGQPTAPVFAEVAEEAEAKPTDPAILEDVRRQEQAWRDKSARLETRREQLRRAIQQQARSQQLEKQKIADLEQSVGDVETRLRGALAQADSLSQDAEHEPDIAALEDEIIALRQKLRLLQNRPTEGNTKYAVIPFDARTGTTRRPILIECTEGGLKFVSEEVVVRPSDLEGFTERRNPLLAASTALIQYWSLWNRQQPDPDQEPEPYVLLIVRPNGTVAYYVAMRMLSGLKQPFGYELLDDGIPLQPPPTDDLAKEICRAAIDEMLAERTETMAQARSGFRTGKGGGDGAGRGPSGDKFEVADVVPPSEEVSERSWENPERFEGRSPNRGSFPPRAASNGARMPKERNNPNSRLPRANPKRSMEVAGSATGRGPANSAGENAAGRTNREASANSSDESSGEETQTNSPSEMSSLPRDRDNQPGGADASRDGARSAAPRSRDNPPRLLPDEDPEQLASDNLARQRQARRHGRRQVDRGSDPGDLHLENLSRRHWGDSDPHARIGMEQNVTVRIDSQLIVVAEDRLIRYDISDPSVSVFFKLMDAIDQESRTWGKPRPGFYWTPRLNFVISPGGNQMFERIDPLLVRSGLSTKREFTLDSVRSASGEAAP